MLRFRVVLFSLLALILLVGCNQSNSQANALPTPATTPIPGWKEIQGGGIALWIPNTYEGGALSGEDRQILIDRIKALGKDFESTAKLIENNSDAFLLYAVDSNTNSQGGTNTINVTTEKVMSVITLDTYLDAASKQFPKQMSIDSRDIVTLDGKQAGKLVVEMMSLGVKEVLYVFKSGNDIYVITYATGPDDFDKLAADFELSAKTFYAKP
ncbi:MAG TPA: hypothetical protein VFK30_13840 [Anaerolineae bacterium]|nr:hypothetical protein [Anaerolineae bacterium]